MADSNSKKWKSVFQPFFSDWLSKLLCFASLKQVGKNHKDDLLFILVLSVIPCNLPIYHKEMGRACLKRCLHGSFFKDQLSQDLRNVLLGFFSSALVQSLVLKCSIAN